MHQASPVRWCVALRIRYMTGSRRLMLPEVMSIFARSVLVPSSNSPARMRANRSRFSSTDRWRYGLSRPGSVRVPRYSEICSCVRSSTYALPALMSRMKLPGFSLGASLIPLSVTQAPRRFPVSREGGRAGRVWSAARVVVDREAERARGGIVLEVVARALEPRRQGQQADHRGL